MGITEQTFYRWMRKSAGLGIAELARLKHQEDENRKLKGIVTDLTLDKRMLLLMEGFAINHKLVYRLYLEQGLELKLAERRRKLAQVRFQGLKAQVPNERWSIDFMADRLEDGRRFQMLT